MLQLEIVAQIIRVREHYEGRVGGQFVVSGDSYAEVYNDLREMRVFEMSKQRWFDRRGRELHAGDKVRGIGTHKEELVYECYLEGNPDQLSLGLNASNEKFLELHPEWPREIYPFDEFSYRLNGGERWLTSYEKVV